MKLTYLDIENFRCFDKLTIDLHPELTVLVAPNGFGKTAVLDAARIALWPFVKAFDLGSQTGKSASIQIDDVRLEPKASGNMEACLPSHIDAKGIWPGNEQVQQWRQARERVKPGTNTLGDKGAKALTRHGEQLQANVRKETPEKVVSLPLIAYLGTGRLWYQGRYTSVASDVNLDKSAYSRLSGYLNCLTISSSFKQFADWYSHLYRSHREAQAIAIEQGGALATLETPFDKTIQAVKTAVNCLIQQQTGWGDIEHSAQHKNQLVMKHPQNGVLPLELLSDGLRNAVAMVADLAYRACKLNPHLGADAITQTAGIAMIDEVDMFLHPAWQQTVLQSLRTAFPAIQFIVTTHSPQVLSMVKRENIRVIGKSGEGEIVAVQPLAATYGEPSGDVMYSVMHVDPQPPVVEKLALQRLTALIDQGVWASAEADNLLQELNRKLGADHPQLQRLQRSIARQQALNQSPRV
jgi:predicted ATP-binding protein involved in virulence